MLRFSQLSIHKKITRLISAAVAIPLLMMLFTLTFIEGQRKLADLTQRIEIQADIVSENAKYSVLLFKDEADTKETLSSLKADPVILSATIANQDNSFSQSYQRDVSINNAFVIPDFFPKTKIIQRTFSHPGNAAQKLSYGKLTISIELYPLYADLLKDFEMNFVIALSFLIIAMLISRRVINQITQPILELAATTEEISKAKNYRIRAKVMGNDEIADLTCRFNEMLAQIQMRDDDLEETVLKRTYDLHKAKQEAEAASKSKSEFLANMSHELRTPMNAIIGMNYLVSQTPLTIQQTDYISKISSSAKLLLEIINDILDFSKMEAGQRKLEAIDFSLDQILEQLISLFSIKTAEKGLELILYRAIDIPDCLVGDPLALGKVLNNLVANAIKFTQQGEIFVSIEAIAQSERDITLLFSVTDTGMGISADYLPELFTAFSQADLSTTRNFGGTGLGLNISQCIIQLMGGEIHVESQLGQGSRFFFTLSLNKSSKTVAYPLLAEKDLLKDKTVLLVDNNFSSKTAVEKWLNSFSVSVQTVANVEAALSELSQKAALLSLPSLVLINSSAIAKMSEPQTQHIFKTLKESFHLPVILTTAFSSHAEMNAHYEGVEKLISKPLTATALFIGLCQVLHQKSHLHLAISSHAHTQTFTRIPNKRILLAEDNVINQQVACEMLKILGLSVTVVNDGQQAVDLLAKEDFDLVFLDIQMPRLDGYAAAQIMRQQLKGKKLPIIAMTAHALESDREKCLAGGMDDHISKPIDPEVLMQLLVKYLGKVDEPVAIATPPNATVTQELPTIDGIDFQDALKRLRNNRGLYAVLLRKFVESHGNCVVEIKQAFERHDFKGAAFIAHTIKGAAVNLGARKLSQLASDIELSLREQELVSESQLILLDEALAEFSKVIDFFPLSPSPALKS